MTCSSRALAPDRSRLCPACWTRRRAMFAIVYNLVRLAMLEAAQRRQIDPDRVSFVDALRWLRCAGQGGSLRPIRVVPERLGRHDPRVKKRRAKNYRLMTKPRSDLMQLLAAQALSP